MKAKDWFGVGIRIIGLIAINYGLYDLFTFAMVELNVIKSSLTSDAHYVTLYIGLIYFFVGLYFLRGASVILDFAYPNQYEQNEIQDSPEETYKEAETEERQN